VTLTISMNIMVLTLLLVCLKALKFMHKCESLFIDKFFETIEL
jgi:hypothetical protein